MLRYKLIGFIYLFIYLFRVIGHAPLVHVNRDNYRRQ